MAFKALGQHIKNLAIPHVSSIVNNFVSGGSQKDSGKVAAKLLKKSGMDIPDSPAQSQVANPLQFSPVQYPLDLGSNELGHYILFESGFVGYSPQTSQFQTGKRVQTGTTGPAGKYKTYSYEPFDKQKITAKTPSHSISTSGIALYMPAGIKTSYNQSYDADTETGLVGDIEAAGVAIGGAEGTAAKVEAALQGVIGATARNAKQILGEFVSLAGVGDPVRFMAKRAGVAVNPRNEAFYNTPNQRTFSFTFDFWPRSNEEAIAVEKIIAIFKYNSAPGFKAGTMGSVFTTPNYWKISYMFNSTENSALNKIGACYCTDVEVDYSPDGQWTTFGDGKPVHTKMTVNMLEDRIITKQDIEQGA